MKTAAANIKPILQINEKMLSFYDGDEKTVVLLTEWSNNEYTAVVSDEDSPVGCGLTELSAIADLFKKLPAARSDREERDMLAERWDHQRDLRKHG